MKAKACVPGILVIGGMNMDILGRAGQAFLAGDSLPGTVLQRPGGVARNIAAGIAANGGQTQLICPLGNDGFGRALREACEKDGIGLDYAIHTDFPSSVYLAIHDLGGDMVCAINDMRAMETLSARTLSKHLSGLKGFDAAVLDANLHEETLVAAADSLAVPLIADPVSAAKCRRLLPILHKLHAIKPNRLEAKALTGEDDIRAAAGVLLQSGVHQVYISLGSEGLYYCDKTESGLLPSLPVPPVSLTGAGDAMTAGLAMGIALGMPMVGTAQYGLRSAASFLQQGAD